MSWEIVNQVLGLAALDEGFAQALLSNPLEALRTWEFTLTPEEEKVFSEISASDLHILSKQLIQKLKHNSS